jgi:hypothetical protein
MTAVSLVAIAQDSAAQSPPPGVDSGHSAPSFAEVLAKAKERQAQHRTYSFAELGMFGLHGAQFSTDVRAEQAVRANSLLPARTEDRGQGAVGTEPQSWLQISPQTDTPQSGGQMDAPPTSRFGNGPIEPLGTNANAVTFASGNPFRMIGSSTGSEPAISGGAARPKPPMPPEAHQSPVHVVVSGPKHALKIAVRDSQAGPAAVKLRRLVESTVAQFEMHVAELHFNGLKGFGPEPVFSLGGGLYGGRAR